MLLNIVLNVLAPLIRKAKTENTHSLERNNFFFIWRLLLCKQSQRNSKKSRINEWVQQSYWIQAQCKKKKKVNKFLYAYIKNTIPFTISPKKVKYLGIDNKTPIESVTDNYNMMMKEIKDLYKWRDIQWKLVRRLHMEMM